MARSAAMNRAWTLRGHSVDTSMDTLSPIPPMECPCPLCPADGNGAKRRRWRSPLPSASACKVSRCSCRGGLYGEPMDIPRSCPGSLAHRSNLRSPRLPLSAPGGAASDNARVKRCFRSSSIWSHYSVRSPSVGSWILGIVLPVSRGT